LKWILSLFDKATFALLSTFSAFWFFFSQKESLDEFYFEL